jgi:hypothetical protein
MTEAEYKRWKRVPLRILLPLLEEWLMIHFPTPYPVKVQYTKKKIIYEGEECAGVFWQAGKKLHFIVRTVGTRREVIDTLLHEWAHAHTLRHANLERIRGRLEDYHDDEFWLAYGRMSRLLYDKGGREEVLTGE